GGSGPGAGRRFEALPGGDGRTCSDAAADRRDGVSDLLAVMPSRLAPPREVFAVAEREVVVLLSESTFGSGDHGVGGGVFCVLADLFGPALQELAQGVRRTAAFR